MKNINKRYIKRIMALLMLCIFLFGTIGCGSKSSSTIVPGSSILPAPKNSSTENQTNNTKDVTLTGVLSFVDTEALIMKFTDVNAGAEYEVPYSGGTDIKNRYDKVIAASTMSMGDIFDVKCDKNGKATSIHESSDYWEKNAITDLNVDEDNRKIKIGGNTYTYENFSVIMSGKDKISIAEIVSQDEVTLHGKDNKVYSIHVDKGHGYIKFTGIDAFIDGYVSIGNSQLLGVTQDMLATAQEGTYKIEMQKGSLVSSKTVTVAKDEQVNVDFSENVVEPTKMGTINFSVEPEGAVMSIDGKEVDYSSPVALAYGKHTIQLSAHYYSDYSEVITVNSDYKTIIIDMTSSSSSSSTSSATKSSTTKSSSTTTATTSATNGYKVNVSAPEGAALYVDSVYIGIIPCSFEKKAGTKTVTLSKTGYATVSYSISVPDATGDQNYAFPDLVESK